MFIRCIPGTADCLAFQAWQNIHIQDDYQIPVSTEAAKTEPGKLYWRLFRIIIGFLKIGPEQVGLSLLTDLMLTMDLYRKKIVAANWKMNTDFPVAEALIRDILQGLPADLACTVIIAPPFTHLSMAKELTRDSPVHIAAQNCYFENAGAFTGEISPAMVRSLGVEYVIVGHSERRQIFHESHEIVKLKLNAIIKAELKPIFCCGEPLEIRDHSTQNLFVRMQMEESLFHLSGEDFKKVCIAYEPIWAIGTGVTATSEQAQEMHTYIREQVAIRYDKIIGEAVRILYGGSIKSENASELFSQEDVDGGLVGGASLNAKGFLEIIKAACG